MDNEPYSPAIESDIPILMSMYLEKYASLEKNLETICAAYLIFQLIHPFNDGNGRTARLICAWYLSQNGYGFLTPYLEKRWNSNQAHRIKIFHSACNNYDSLGANPKILANFIYD